mmetsp:Transcript_19772/g.26070  ORF Transcript_19772/g.26070 Transcript_19772/m.26070 type:complete len:492 (-) Transcript_19772:128-1603(-)
MFRLLSLACAISASLAFRPSLTEELSRFNAQNNATPRDQIASRTRKGEYLSIPQAERCSTRDLFHDSSTIPSTYTLQRIRHPIILTMVWTLIGGATLKVLLDIRGQPYIQSKRKVSSTQNTSTKNSDDISSNPRSFTAKFLTRLKRHGLSNISWEMSRLNTNTATPRDEITFRTRKGEYLSIPQAERYTTRDWFHNLSTIPSSYTLQRIRQPIFLTMFWTLIVHTARLFLGSPGLSPKAHTFVSSALGLLLVFRTNAAYNRFWEGRQIWQKIINESRSIARTISLYKCEIGKCNQKRLANLLCAFPIILQEHLKGVRQPHRTEYFLDSDDFCDLGRASNRPLCLVNKMAKVVKSVEFTEAYTSRERLAILSMINKLSDHVGACERLVQTPVPLAYARHTSRFLSIWILTLPFVLDDVGFFVVPAMGLIAWALFGIQEIGLIIEDPFKRALKLDVKIDTIYADVIQTLGSQDILPIYQSTPYFANFDHNSPS